MKTIVTALQLTRISRPGSGDELQAALTVDQGESRSPPRTRGIGHQGLSVANRTSAAEIAGRLAERSVMRCDGPGRPVRLPSSRERSGRSGTGAVKTGRHAGTAFGNVPRPGALWLRNRFLVLAADDAHVKRVVGPVAPTEVVEHLSLPGDD
jgi:hypothetical protein